MVGQHKNLMKIQKWVKNNSFPRFLIVSGNEGSGRLTLSKEIIKRLNASGVIAENNSIETVRQIISNAYQNNSTCVYIFRDIDNMSIAAQNALLKVAEEPPNNSYIICTAQNVNSVLSTIKSRAVEIQIEPYSKDELKNFSDDVLVLNYATVPGECEMDADEIKKAEDLSKDIVDILYNGKGTQLLKECLKLKNKKDDDGIECKLFYKVFKRNCPIRLPISVWYDISSDLETCLSNKSINDKSAIESYLLKIFVALREKQNETN